MVNEGQIKKWMRDMVPSYAKRAGGRVYIDSENLAKDAFYFFTGDYDQPIPNEYKALAIQVANEKIAQIQ